MYSRQQFVNVAMDANCEATQGRGLHSSKMCALPLSQRASAFITGRPHAHIGVETEIPHGL